MLLILLLLLLLLLLLVLVLVMLVLVLLVMMLMCGSVPDDSPRPLAHDRRASVEAKRPCQLLERPGSIAASLRVEELPRLQVVVHLGEPRHGRRPGRNDGGHADVVLWDLVVVAAAERALLLVVFAVVIGWGRAMVSLVVVVVVLLLGRGERRRRRRLLMISVPIQLHDFAGLSPLGRGGSTYMRLLTLLLLPFRLLLLCPKRQIARLERWMQC